jgi:type I restriction enzyme R subunit
MFGIVWVLIRWGVRMSIEEDLADVPYAQKVFGELLRQAIAEAEAMFDHPLKQFSLFRKFEDRLAAMQVPGIPDRLAGADRQARAYYGAIRLELGEDKLDGMLDSERGSFIDLSLEIDAVVRNAVAENSLNPQSIEAAIRKSLLPRLFQLMGLDHARGVVEQVVQITRIGLSRT